MNTTRLICYISIHRVTGMYLDYIGTEVAYYMILELYE